MSNTITVIGNLTADPELRFTPNGVAVCSGSVACNDRYRDGSGEWQQSLNGFFNFTIWRQQGQAAAEYLKKGNRVIVTGRLNQRSWETDEGERRWATEIQVDEIAKSLMFVETKDTKQKTSKRRSSKKKEEPAPEPENEEIPF